MTKGDKCCGIIENTCGIIPFRQAIMHYFQYIVSIWGQS